MSKQVRRSVTLPLQIARQVELAAKGRGVSGSEILRELIEMGLRAYEQNGNAFFELANRFRGSKSPHEVKRLGHQLGSKVFGA